MFRRRLLLFFFVVTIAISNWGVSAGEYIQLPGVMHVHSTFSSGRYSIGELVSRAEEKGIEILILTDHDQVVMEYGIFPFRSLIKKREERPSVLNAGPQNYLDAIERLNRRQQSVLLIPAVQSSPFYYWSGSPFGHYREPRIFIISVSDP